MLNLIEYVVIGMVVAFAFKFVVGLLTVGVGVAVMALMGFKERRIEMLFLKHTKVFFAYGVLLNTTIGVVYCMVIALITLGFINEKSANAWIYKALSFAWALTILRGADLFRGILLSSCLGGLVLVYVGFGILAPVVTWVLVAIVSLAYYFGRIEVAKHQFIRSGVFREEECGNAQDPG